MPRPPRRAPAAQAGPEMVTTPTRPTATNAITATIPPFMLETPPHAPFLTTPLPPTNNPGDSIIPEANAGRARNSRAVQQTPTAVTNSQDAGADHSIISTNALGSAVSEPGHGDEQSLLESIQHNTEDSKQLVGLREISSLATWTLSSAKPGCALAELRHPSPTQFWQSDGPQPHTLTLHFFKLVAIVKMRVYLDFELDESYTPTKMRFFAGMSEGALVEFGSWEVSETVDPETGETHSSIEGVRGWIDVPLAGVGGTDTRYYDVGHNTRLRDGNADQDYTMSDSVDEQWSENEGLVGGDVLKAMVVQIRICENHQNGKDTHVRGFQIFSRDESGSQEIRKVVKKQKGRGKTVERTEGEQDEIVGLQPAGWMIDVEIR